MIRAATTVPPNHCRPARALDAYRRNTELHPLHTASRNNLAVIYNQLQRYDEATAE